MNILALLAAAAFAQAPNMSTYQGRLQESGLPVTGSRLVEVHLCTALTGGVCFPGTGTNIQGVSVVNGVFKTTFTIPSGVDISVGQWFLEIAVGATAPLNTLAPREAFTSFPYAIYASSATKLLGTVNVGQIDAGNLDTNVVVQGFAKGQAGTAALADAAVDTAKLAADSVQTSKLMTDAVDSGKILNGAVQTAKIKADSVDFSKILNAAVGTAKIAPDAVDSSKILNAAVSTSKLATFAVDTTKLNADSVTTIKILDSAVTTVKIAPLAVDNSRLGTASVTALKIAPNSIDTGKLTPDTVTNSAILNFSVDVNKLAAAAVSTSKVAADAVTAAAILNGSVGTAKITAGAIDTPRLGNNTVSADKLMAGAFLRNNIGVDGLGAMTRMGAVNGTGGGVTLNIPARKHVEVFIHIPPLLSSTDVRIQMNGLVVNSYAVSRSTGGYPYSNVNAAGIDMLGVAGSFPTGSQIDIRLTIQGNTGTPSFITGTFQAVAFQGVNFVPTPISGSFGVNVAGLPVTSVFVAGLSAALPVGTYIAAYGEEFP
ncbi:MAG: hypothetical protein HY925_13930 [Elusimicrobia bacterium]|nr:hypothetical protein [Elusimicrobiota bacterium]